MKSDSKCVSADLIGPNPSCPCPQRELASIVVPTDRISSRSPGRLSSSAILSVITRRCSCPVGTEALAARLEYAESYEYAGEIDGAHILVSDDDTAGAKNGSRISPSRRSPECTDMLSELSTPPSGPTGLEQLELLAVRHASSDLVDDLT